MREVAVHFKAGKTLPYLEMRRIISMSTEMGNAIPIPEQRKIIPPC